MKNITITLTGLAGVSLLTHNERLANPGDPYAIRMKSISSKRKKTEEDFAEMAEIEFAGGLYLDDSMQIGLPAWNVFRSMQDGAKLNKLGRHVQRGLVMTDVDILPLKHDGPTTPEDAWRAGCYDQRAVKVGTSKVSRTRPCFRNWHVEATAALDTNVLSLEDLRMIADNAGSMVGIGDYRPRFGRFTAEVN